MVNNIVKGGVRRLGALYIVIVDPGGFANKLYVKYERSQN